MCVTTNCKYRLVVNKNLQPTLLKLLGGWVVVDSYIPFFIGTALNLVFNLEICIILSAEDASH